MNKWATICYIRANTQVNGFDGCVMCFINIAICNERRERRQTWARTTLVRFHQTSFHVVFSHLQLALLLLWPLFLLAGIFAYYMYIIWYVYSPFTCRTVAFGIVTILTISNVQSLQSCARPAFNIHNIPITAATAAESLEMYNSWLCANEYDLVYECASVNLYGFVTEPNPASMLRLYTYACAIANIYIYIKSYYCMCVHKWCRDSSMQPLLP